MEQINIFIKIINKFIKKLLFLFIKFYQRFITFFIGSNHCRFHPSCSNYMIESIEKKGLVKGIFLGIKRILKCNPFYKKTGFDPVD
jgi:putative membrane protein insertion efficiency factor